MRPPERPQKEPGVQTVDRHGPSVGSLVGRPDLGEAEIRAAIVERLRADGREGIDPDIVLHAALLGKRKALAFLRKLVLPPPRAVLAMPVRPILRSQIRAEKVSHAG